MRLKTYLMSLLFACVIAGFAFNVQAQSKVVAEWTRYELGKGTFSVLFPSKPKEEFQPSPADLAVPIDLYMYTVEANEGVFAAQYGLLGEAAERWRESAAEAFYDGMWEGLSSGFDKQMETDKLAFRTVLQEKRKTSFSGYNGREIVFTVGPLRGRILMTIVGRHAFTAMVLRTEQMPLADQERFLNSFTIKQPLAQPAKTTK
jgi:hypothetical protein